MSTPISTPLSLGRRRVGLRTIAVVFGIVSIYVGCVQRKFVVRAAPSSAPLFSSIGLRVNTLEADIRSVKARIDSLGSESNLVIEGEIVNLRKDANTIPDIRLSLLDESGTITYSWIAPLPSKTLKASEKLTFRANLASPPAGNRRVIVTFAG